MTPDSATAAAADLLPPGDLTLVVVGDAAALADGLVAAGFDVEVVAADAVLSQRPIALSALAIWALASFTLAW